MYCHFCGNAITDDGKFCGYCGKQIKSFSPSLLNSSGLIFYILGAVFILSGIIPYFLKPDLTHLLPIWFNKFGISGYTAIAYFKNFTSLCTSASYTVSSAFALYTGFLLLKREVNPKGCFIACTIVHSLSVINSFIANILVFSLPKFVLSLFVSDNSIISEGLKIIEKHPSVFSSYQFEALGRLIISAIIISLSLVFLCSKKQCFKPLNIKNTPFPIGGFLMLYVIPVISLARDLYSSLLYRYFIGPDEIAGAGSANSIFSYYFNEICICLFWAIIAIMVFFNKSKKSVILIPTICITTLLVIIALLLSGKLLMENNTPAHIYMLAKEYLISDIIDHTVFLLSLIFWFYYISRNKMPKWFQITLPITIPFIYVILDFIFIVLLHSLSHDWCVQTIVSLIIILLPLVFSSKKQQNQQYINQNN